MSQERVNKQQSIIDYANFLAKVRAFMSQKDIYEVITDPLMPAIIPDRGVDPIKVSIGMGEYYLHTSPEWEMKKLLAEGAGSIYQMVSVFRDDLAQNWHKPAFIMLEWYEVGANDDDLINQCLALFEAVDVKERASVYSCRDLYLRHANIDIALVDIEALKRVCESHKIDASALADKSHMSSWLEVIWLNLVEPELEGLVVVKDFPVCQSALAKIVDKPHPHAKRFEIYLNGCELANGYDETTDTTALQARFNAYEDQYSIVDCAELASMPECSGVSVGTDRLYALVKKQTSLYTS